MGVPRKISHEVKEVKKKGKPLPCDSPDEEEFEKQQAKMHQQELRIKDLTGELEIAQKNMKELNKQIDEYQDYVKNLEVTCTKRIAESRLRIDLDFIDKFIAWIRKQDPTVSDIAKQVIPQVNRYNRTSRISAVLRLLDMYLKEIDT